MSEEAKDLVMRILDVDPAKRLTTSQILSHPWMTNRNQPTTHLLVNQDTNALKVNFGQSYKTGDCKIYNYSLFQGAVTATFQAIRNQSPLVPTVGNIGKLSFNHVFSSPEKKLVTWLFSY